jgi:hypothetical protein
VGVPKFCPKRPFISRFCYMQIDAIIVYGIQVFKLVSCYFS